jgi:phosphatidylglycerophosphate synthase
VHPNINPANAVTASRALTLPPFVYFVDQGMQQWATLMVIVCGLLDLLDGAVAKWFDCRTPFGEMFDALADAVCYGFMMLIGVIYGMVPLFPFFVIVGMGVINTLMRGVYARRAGRTTNYRSFGMERVVAFSAYCGGFGITGYQVEYFYWCCAAVITVVMLHDTKRMLVDPIPELPAATPAATTPEPASRAVVEST